MHLVRMLLLGLALLVTVGGLVIGGIYRYRMLTRPTLARAGGTVLTYEVDVAAFPDGQPPSDYQPEELAEALKRRLDPGGWDGITVTPVSPTLIEIGVPNAGDHATHLQQIKDLIALVGPGRLEFRILANSRDDEAAIDAAQEYFAEARRQPMIQAQLEALAAAGKPLPSPQNERNEPTFPTANDGEHTYSWVELDRSMRHTVGLNNDAADDQDPRRREFWKAVAEARSKRETFPILGECLLFSRDVLNSHPPDQSTDKKYEYFVLTREPEKGKEILGKYLSNAFATRGPDDEPQVGFHFNDEGGRLFRELTTRNAPSWSGGEIFHRFIAVILDGRIESAPFLNASIGNDGVIQGRFTEEEVDRMVTILRAGALPATLKPVPVSEVTIEKK